MAVVRNGMSELIDLVERLVDDSSNAYHSEEEVQDALDQNRREGRYLRLHALKSVASGGTVTYVTFLSPSYDWRYWESTSELLDYNYDALTPSAADWFTGRWTFATEPTQPVMVNGFSYDPYGAAYDLLTVRASMLAEDVQTFSAAQGSFGYVEKRRGPAELAAKYLSMSRKAFASSNFVRTDVEVW